MAVLGIRARVSLLLVMGISTFSSGRGPVVVPGMKERAPGLPKGGISAFSSGHGLTGALGMNQLFKLPITMAMKKWLHGLSPTGAPSLALIPNTDWILCVTLG